MCGTALIRGVCLAAILASASTSMAFTIMLTGNTAGNPPEDTYKVVGLVPGDKFNVDWAFQDENLSGTGMVMLDALTATTANISIMVTNTSTLISGINPRVTGVGLGVLVGGL